MIYSEQINRALRLCYQAHAGQVDKSGVPYVFHPVHLAEQMPDEVSTVAALLHDVVEDTAWTFRDLEEMGFVPDAIAALRLLTHEDDTPYDVYVRRLASNPIARRVKIADLRHNLDQTRMPGQPVNEVRREKYLAALNYLLSLDAEA